MYYYNGKAVSGRGLRGGFLTSFIVAGLSILGGDRSKDKGTEPEPGMSEFKMKLFRFVSGGLCGEATPLEVMMFSEC